MQGRLQFRLLRLQFDYCLLVRCGLDERLDSGNVRFQFLLRERFLFRHRRGRVHAVLLEIQARVRPVLAGIVPEALVRAREMDKIFHARLRIRPYAGLGHFLFHGQPLRLHLPLGKRAHSAPTAKPVGRVVCCPKLMESRIDLAVQNGMGRTHPPVHDRDILPVGA